MSLQYIKYIELEHVHGVNSSFIAHSYHIRIEKAHLVIPNTEERNLVHLVTVPHIPLRNNVFTFSITCKSAKYVILYLTFFTTTNQFMFYENHHMNTSVFPSKYKKSFISVCVIQQ